MSASFLEAASERRASLRSSTSDLELSDSTDYEEDETAWRAGDDDGDEGEALDDRVAGAFDKLNVAIALTRPRGVQFKHDYQSSIYAAQDEKI